MKAVICTSLAGLLITAAPAVEAQPAGKNVGILLFSSPQGDANLAAFRRGLADLGYVEGRDVALVYRYAEGKPERLPALAAQLAALSPHVIFAMGGDVAPYARAATTTIPIVMATSTDPVRSGLAVSLARPGGNITGVTFISSELAAKRLQLLKEAMPALSRIAVIWNPDHVDPEYAETQAAGRTLGVRVQSVEVRRAEDFEPALRIAADEQAEAIIVVSSRLMTFNRQRVLEFADRQGIPVVSGWGPWAEGGALMSYGPDLDAIVRRAATHVDRVLKGASPGTLPIEQATKHQLVVNLRAARKLGVTIPPSLLVQAARIIE